MHVKNLNKNKRENVDPKIQLKNSVEKLNSKIQLKK